MVLEMVPSAERSNSSFFLLRGHCFRISTSITGLANRCDEPVAWKGLWRDVKGEVWIVEACARHRSEMKP